MSGPCLGQVNTGITISGAPDEQTPRRIVAEVPVTGGGSQSCLRLEEMKRGWSDGWGSTSPYGLHIASMRLVFTGGDLILPMVMSCACAKIAA
jgi:hypothetical protein